MKSTLLTTALLLSTLLTTAQSNVGIGTTTPNPKAILELQATDKGLLVPRLSTVQINAITTPPNGLLVYNTTEECFNYYNTSTVAWKSMCSATGIVNSGDTVIVNLLKVDSIFVHLIKADGAFIKNLFATYIKADSAYIKLLHADSIFVKYLQANSIKADTITANTGNFTNLNVGGISIDSLIKLQTLNQFSNQSFKDSLANYAWVLKGNTAPTNNKLGTLNARDLHIITNNTERISIMSGTGNVGIGQTLPAEKLDVIGNTKTTGSLEFGAALKPAGLNGTTGDILISQGALAPIWVAQNTIAPTITNTLTNPINTITSTVNGVLATAPAVNTVNNTLTGTNLTTTVNGVVGTAIDLSTIIPPSNNWNLLGNAGTSPATNFIGTTDNQSLVLKTNNTEHLKIDSTGKVTITVKDTGNYQFNSVATVTTTTPIKALVVGNYMFVGGYYSANTLEVYSLANPALPVLVNSVPTNGWCSNIVLHGKYLYLTYRLNSLLDIYDVSNPLLPVLVSSTTVLFYGYSIQPIDTNYIYVSDGGTIKIVNVANPASPIIVSTITTIGNYASVKVGNRLYVSNSSANAFEVWDVTNPLTPTVLGSLNIAGFGFVDVLNNYAYVANYATNSINVIDFSNPITPVLVTSVALPAVSVMKIRGRYLYVNGGNFSQFSILDLNNPAAPVVSASYFLGLGSSAFDIAGDYLYQPYYNSNVLEVFKIGTPYSINSPALTVKLTHSSSTIARFENWSGVSLIDHNGISSSSDQTLKHNITNLPSGSLAKLTALRGVTFAWNNDPTEKTYAGIIAQEVIKQFPLLVTTDEKTNKFSVNYAGFAPYFIEAIKELNTKQEIAIKNQQQQIEILLKRLDALENKK